MTSKTEQRKRISLGIIKDTDRVLLVKRRKIEEGSNSEKLTWVFPGGEVEANESNEETCIREVWEETGYTVKILAKVDEKEHEVFPVYVSYFACQLVHHNQEIVTDKEISESRWISIKDLESFITSSLNAKVKEFLEEYT